MKKQVLCAAVAAGLSSFAMADYQFEIGGAYGQGDIEAAGFDVDYDQMGVTGEFHFDRVNTGKGPLAEAAFLDKSSFLEFAYNSLEPDVNGLDDIDTFAFGGRFVTASNLIIEADYSSTDYGDDDEDTIGVGIGTYLNATTDIVVSYHTTDEEDADLDVLDAQLHGVSPLAQGASIAYDLGLAFIDADDDDGYSLNAGATYYFNNMFGIGISADVLDVDSYEEDTVTLDVSYFPQPNIELAFSYFDTSAEEDSGLDLDSDGFLLGVAVRF